MKEQEEEDIVEQYAAFNVITHEQVSPPMVIWCLEQWEDDWHSRNGWNVELEVHHV